MARIRLRDGQAPGTAGAGAGGGCAARQGSTPHGWRMRSAEGPSSGDSTKGRRGGDVTGGRQRQDGWDETGRRHDAP